MSEQRLREIAERDRLGIARQVTEYRSDWDRAWLLANTTNAMAYIDRILAHNPNGAELMFLGEVKRILQGLSDGRPNTEASDAK